MRVRVCGVVTWVAATLAGVAAPVAEARLQVGSPLEVRILYDNSGSMFPGYKPHGGTPRSVSGAHFFHEYPSFREWLADFIQRQTLLSNKVRIGMRGFTSRGAWRPGDMYELHDAVSPPQFDVGAAVARLPPPGSTTNLTEALAQGTHGFEGLVWLVTDNIVETASGSADQDVRRFFESMRDAERYRSVHLYALPFPDPSSGQQATLAIYAILVADEAPDEAVLNEYDRRFRSTFKAATRANGQPLFPGQEHRKLKDLSIDAFEPQVEVILQGHNMGFFAEDGPVQLKVIAQLRSHLTQHSVTSGSYRLTFSSFEPDGSARRDFGLRPIPASEFPSATGTLTAVIPPNGSQWFERTITSRRPQSLRPKGLGGWLRAAASGLSVDYTGKVRVSFSNIRVRLEAARLAGIYGIDAAPEIFNTQDVQGIRDVKPSSAVVKFSIFSSSQRTLLLLLILLILLAPLGLAVFALTRKCWFRITLASEPPRTVGLRRLSGENVIYQGHHLGRLSRGLGGSHAFRANTGNAAFTVTSSAADVYDVTIRDGTATRLVIEVLGGNGKVSGTRSTTTQKGITRPAPATATPGGGRRGSPPPIPRPGGSSKAVAPRGGAPPSAPASGSRPKIRRP